MNQEEEARHRKDKEAASQNLDEIALDVSTASKQQTEKTPAFVKELSWKAHVALDRFNAPTQIGPTHERAIAVCGRFGWGAKATMFAIIGGLACNTALDVAPADGSPEGAFKLLGSNVVGIPLLIVLATGVALYSTWRYWEGYVGQAYDDEFPPWKNFFKYRLSPFVSGSIYLMYLALILALMVKVGQESTERRNHHGDRGEKLRGNTDLTIDTKNKKEFPTSWNSTSIGRAGLAFAGIGFMIAVITQLDAARGTFHRELRLDRPWWIMLIVKVAGTIGLLARATVFAFVGVLFFRSIGDNVTADKTTIADALDQIQTSPGGRAGLFIMGAGLVIYGLFATLCLYARTFPTRVPSGHKATVHHTHGDSLLEEGGGSGHHDHAHDKHHHGHEHGDDTHGHEHVKLAQDHVGEDGQVADAKGRDGVLDVEMSALYGGPQLGPLTGSGRRSGRREGVASTDGDEQGRAADASSKAGDGVVEVETTGGFFGTPRDKGAPLKGSSPNRA